MGYDLAIRLQPDGRYLARVDGRLPVEQVFADPLSAAEWLLRTILAIESPGPDLLARVVADRQKREDFADDSGANEPVELPEETGPPLSLDENQV